MIDREIIKILLPEIKSYANMIQICGVTLLGMKITEYPAKGGNCFDILTDKEQHYKIANFSYENIKELLQRGLTYPIKIAILGEYTALIHDERISSKWYASQLCSVCCPQDLLPLTQRLQIAREENAGNRITYKNGSTSFGVGIGLPIGQIIVPQF